MPRESVGPIGGAGCKICFHLFWRFDSAHPHADGTLTNPQQSNFSGPNQGRLRGIF